MQLDRTISLSCVFATVLWALTTFLIMAGTAVALTCRGSAAHAVALSLMAHGLACSAGAATVTIRNGFAQQNRKLEDAFRLGQESGAGVRRVGS